MARRICGTGEFLTCSEGVIDGECGDNEKDELAGTCVKRDQC